MFFSGSFKIPEWLNQFRDFFIPPALNAGVIISDYFR